MSGETLNYYYLGHVAAGVADQAARPGARRGLPARWGLLIALTATAVYAFAGTLWAAARERSAPARRAAGRSPPGSSAAALVDDPRQPRRRARRGSRPTTRRNDYAWFDPSRVIPDTINEFPSFSFILGDLHAHVLALPFTVLALAFALQVALRGPRGDAGVARGAEALAAALAVGALYAINSWSYPVAAGLLAASVITWLRDRRRGAARLRDRLAGAGAASRASC